MKYAAIIIFSFLSAVSKAQLTFNDIYIMGTSINNPYVINQRSIRDVIDTLQQKGYVLTLYNQVAATSPATGRTDAFAVENVNNPNETLRIVSVYVKVDGRVSMTYSITLTTQDFNQYNKALLLVRKHPDFVRTILPEVNFLDTYDAKPSVGENRRILFTIMTTGSTQTGINATKPLTYQINLIRTQ